MWTKRLAYAETRFKRAYAFAVYGHLYLARISHESTTVTATDTLGRLGSLDEPLRALG
jgi:hypothetical protein